MRLAAFYAGLTFNAAFLQYAVFALMPGANPLSLVLGPLVWGLFLVGAVYLVPARTGLGPRELVEALLGPWVGGFFWHCWLPLWAVSWFADLTATFRYTVHAPFFRWEEAGRASGDTQIAVLWPWVVLTGLAGLAAVEEARTRVRISAVILLAAPFAYREGWPEIWTYLGPAECSKDVFGMQDLTLWLAPALLFAGRFPGRTLRNGFWGIAMPMVAAGMAAFYTVAGGGAVRGRSLRYLDMGGGWDRVGVIKTVVGGVSADGATGVA